MRWKKSKKSLPILGDNDYLIGRYSILDDDIVFINERMAVIKYWAYFEGVTTDE